MRLSRYLTPTHVPSESESILLAMNRVELLYHYHESYPHIHTLFTSTLTTIATYDHVTTLTYITNMICQSLFTTVCDHIIRYLQSSDHCILQPLRTALDPILQEYITTLSSYIQRCNDFNDIISMTSKMVAQLRVIPGYEDVEIACWRVLSDKCDDTRVIQGLATTYERKLHRTQHHDIQTYPSCWKRYQFGYDSIQHTLISSHDVPSSYIINQQDSYSRGIETLLREMITDALELLVVPPCPFAIVATGENYM